MALKIKIETIAHNSQRYNTIGDWWTDYNNSELVIKVSELPNWKYEALIAVHELIEQLLCLSRGISEEEVTLFDTGCKEDDEPGNSPQAPYHKEHIFATNVERLLAAELGVNWDEYEKVLERICRSYPLH